MARLFIFNPETDFALGSDRNHYTATRRVAAMQRRLQFIHKFYSHPGDYFLTLTDDGSDRFFVADDQNKPRPCDTETALKNINNIVPWGWNRALRHRLRNIGITADILPDDQTLGTIRRIAHRATTIEAIKILKEHLEMSEIDIPMQVNSIGEAHAVLASGKEKMLKSPWSSSGRGVFDLSELTDSQIDELLSGIIRRQGSAMLEKKYNIKLDCATEWLCRGGKAEYVGFSIFESSGRSNYKGNLVKPQPDLEEMFNKISTIPASEIVKAQKIMLERIVSPHYDGPLGIDMLVTEQGVPDPCVEINLRHTMGHIAIECHIATSFCGNLTPDTLATLLS